MANGRNIDRDTVDGFGQEWSRFDQAGLTESELRKIYESSFSLFPWDQLPADAQGFDLGCGSGRWARFVAPRVGTLHCIDPADAALDVARRSLANQPNCVFHLAGVDAMPLEDASMDFGYSIGVLNFVPDALAGLRACALKLKPGAPFLVYIMYALDNRPAWFRMLWRASDWGRRLISRMPFGLRSRMCDAIALTVYWPLARLALLVERTGRNVTAWPLSAYRDRSFYVMRTDALDRFGTRLSRRFTRAQVENMLEQAGFAEIVFREDAPYWTAVGSGPHSADGLFECAAERGGPRPIEWWEMSPKVAAREGHRTAPVKSDALDAFSLADLLRRQAPSWRPLRRPSETLAELQALVRDREGFVIEHRRVQHRLRATLLTYYPALPHLFSQVDRAITLAFLRRFPTPQAAGRLTVAGLARFLKREGYTGRVPRATMPASSRSESSTVAC